MKKFIDACDYVRMRYPKLWSHHGKINRRIMVAYHLPGAQLPLFGTSLALKVLNSRGWNA